MLGMPGDGEFEVGALSRSGWRFSELATGARDAALSIVDYFHTLGAGRDARGRPIKRQQQKTRRAAIASTARVPEGRRAYAIGDVHGRADLLVRLIDMIVEREGSAPAEAGSRPIVVLLGDYVDRGFQSKEVIEVLLSGKLSRFETYFLKGNHEAAMLQFLQDPTIGPKWAEFGGIETLVSYGVKPPRGRTNMADWGRVSEDLRKALPPEHFHFLSNLILSVRIGDYVFVHAGVRPGRPIDQQSEYDLLWIRDEFLSDKTPLEAVIVHGHTPTQQPYRDLRRIGVDTGAYLSGRLTAVRFERESVEFITTNV